MVFNSYFFILIYLPILLIGWFGLNRWNRRAAEVFLIAMSLWFYGCFGPACLAVLILSILMNYLFGRDLEGRKGRMIAGVVCNLLLLGWFKYVTPAVSSSLPDASALPTFLTLSLPIGLSFYTFTQISYLVDRYRGEVPQEGFLRYVLYASYFPKLAEGPITRYEEVMSQFRDEAGRKVNPDNVTRGLVLFILGMSKKLLIADTLAPAASHGFESVYYLDTLSVIVTVLCYTLQLYFDFSGFCEMAMGISQMLNIRLPVNFDAPFRAFSYSELWRRWHATLSRFFTQYVYIPLGGSRKGTARTCLHILIVFMLSGLWHGTGWTYLAWGLLTGILVIGSRRYGRWHNNASALSSVTLTGPGARRAGNPEAAAKDAAGRKPEDPGAARETGGWREKGRILWRRVRILSVFALSMIIFGASSLGDSAVMLRQLFVPRFPGWLYRMAGQVDVSEFWLVNKAVSLLFPALENPAALAELLLVMCIALILIFQKKTAVQISQSMAFTTRNAVLIGILAVWCLSSLSGVSTYVYFQF